MKTLLLWPGLERFREVGPVLLRLYFGITLIWGTADNVFSEARMVEFSQFLAQQGFYAPMACARLSAWAQFLCGVLIVAGFAVRPAACVMLINFLVALGMVHTKLPFSANIAPLAMLACALFFLLFGAGLLSVDGRLSRAA